MNKVLVKIYVPMIEEKYEVWIPLNKSIYNVCKLLLKAINELTGGTYMPNKLPTLYNKATGKPYDINSSINETSIRNGSEIILL